MLTHTDTDPKVQSYNICLLKKKAEICALMCILQTYQLEE